jgi:DNA-binding XRE family transcriptional regulator
MEVPKQIESGNISPINPDGKGKGYITKNRIFGVCKHLKLDPESIDPESWSKNEKGVFVSWKGFHLLPELVQSHIKKIDSKRGYDFGIKTGKQKDGRFLIVFDLDNDNEKAIEYKEFIFKLYGKTFTRNTPSRGFHLYYKSPAGWILKNNQHVDLRRYITIDDKPLDMEIKQGSFIKEIGANRQTVEDLEIKELNPEINLIESILASYPTAHQIKPFFEDKVTSKPHINKETLEVSNNKLFEILDTKYLPIYISVDLKGERDNSIIPATFGFLITRNMSVTQMKKVLIWINEVAEIKKAEKHNKTPDHRNYNFNSIPAHLAGGPTLIKYGFGDFVNAINSLDPEYIQDRQTEKVHGEYTINTVSMDYPTNHLPMFETLQNIVGIRSRSHKHILKMIYYTMVSSINADTVVKINGARHDLRISTIFVAKQGQGKTEILNTTAKVLKDLGMTVHRPTSFHSEQWIGKTKIDKKAENGTSKIMGYLYDDVIVVDEAKRLISDDEYAEVRRNARISQNRYGTSPVEKKNVDTDNKDKISYDSKTILLYGVQDMKMDAEDFITEGDVRRYVVSVLDNETMDSQDEIIRSVMEEGREFVDHENFVDYLNKIPRLKDEIFIKLAPEERVLYELAVINLNTRANSYSKMVSEHFGTLGAEYIGLLLKFVVNYSLIRMVKQGITSENPVITKDDILYAYVDCFEMLEHRYEWVHFYLVMDSSLVHKDAKYIKEIEVLSSFDIGQPIEKHLIKSKIQEVYKVKDRQAVTHLSKFIDNGFVNEINNKNIEIVKIPGKRVKREDEKAIEMYNYALEKIENIKNLDIEKSPVSQSDDWNYNPTKKQSELSL